ncbi:hypothetical protein [Prauserella flavalba]|uniref:hypothetical protein n=1 Tax=Prauserella flavalba TaxID=1477506 RepID=UPI0036E2408B
MATDWTTAIQHVAIRVTGEIASDVDLSHAGTPDAVAHVFVGSILAHVKGRRTAQRLVAIWRDAAVHQPRLPELARRERTRYPDAECPAGLVITIGPDAVLTQQLLPATGRAPVHLRIQVGPLVWLVLDRAAYTSTRALWERVADTL